MQLFTPFELSGRRLRNRIVFPAVLSNYAREHRVTTQLVDYYAERAAGGAAMLVTEGLSIHASSVKTAGLVHWWALETYPEVPFSVIAELPSQAAVPPA